MRPTKPLQIDPDHLKHLNWLASSGNSTVSLAERSKIILLKAEGKSSQSIADELGVNRHTVDLWINKYRQRKEGQSIEEILSVSEGRGRKHQFSGEAKTWIIAEACTKPKELGYAAELWTYSELTKHIQNRCVEAGYPELKTISKTEIYAILENSNIKPFRIKYYCYSKDPEFEAKMNNLLLLYKLLSLQFDVEGNLLPYYDGEYVHVLSYDEKPGIQATLNVGEDMPPKPSKCAHWARNYEYKRGGTLSLLAAIDLQTGKAFPLVRESHKSSDYVDFLKMLDEHYPKSNKIRLVLDNLRVHTSKETLDYLRTIPGRFEFVFTPTHGSWLNLVESFFSKLTKQCLKGVRVKNKAELADRIYRYFDEINEEPVVYKWQWHIDEIDISARLNTTTLIEGFV